MTEYNELEQFVSDYDAAIDEFEKVRQHIMKDLQTKLKTAFVKFFEANPEVEFIQWTQYTPYFNDGEECIFSVNEMGYKLKNDNSDYSYYDLSGRYVEREWYHDKRYAVEYAQFKEMIENIGLERERLDQIEDSFNNFTAVLSKLDEDVFKTTFGDHVIITADINGFDVEEYDHD